MALKSANLAVRFLLELCVLGALGYWGSRTGPGLLSRYGLAIGAPLLAALLWGTLGAPGASIKLPSALHLLLELAVFGSGALALYAAGRHGLAGAFALVILINRALIYLWGQ